jgi:hypothetical protein
MSHGLAAWLYCSERRSSYHLLPRPISFPLGSKVECTDPSVDLHQASNQRPHQALRYTGMFRTHV